MADTEMRQNLGCPHMDTRVAAIAKADTQNYFPCPYEFY